MEDHVRKGRRLGASKRERRRANFHWQSIIIYQFVELYSVGKNLSKLDFVQVAEAKRRLDTDVDAAPSIGLQENAGVEMGGRIIVIHLHHCDSPV